ncbi:unnamed protein product [Clavelina lepadiformis]|uniref:Uncharacterized protein n=1 Tax=Clavelina lepadiformis TaxID=159417 RepID=A0ABP0GMY2_CLALP
MQTASAFLYRSGRNFSCFGECKTISKKSLVLLGTFLIIVELLCVVKTTKGAQIRLTKSFPVRSSFDFSAEMQDNNRVRRMTGRNHRRRRSCSGKKKYLNTEVVLGINGPNKWCRDHRRQNMIIVRLENEERCPWDIWRIDDKHYLFTMNHGNRILYLARNRKGKLHLTPRGGDPRTSCGNGRNKFTMKWDEHKQSYQLYQGNKYVVRTSSDPMSSQLGETLTLSKDLTQGEEWNLRD